MPGYFVDTSALAKLYHWEAGSERMEALIEAPDARLIISQLSLVEIESVFATKVRTGVIDKAALAQLRGRFYADLSQGRFAVALLARRHFQGAEALVRTYAVDHALRTLDALQLAMAIDLCRRGAASELVSSDKALCEVAVLEGLTVLNPS
ncbi:MAG: type II toxin-antitoxin system VapC family toxin, partial [Bryobacteraceae bacterium]